MDALQHMQKSLAELLILSCIREEASFSYYISKRIQERSEGAIRISAGCIIPYLHRLLDNGQIRVAAKVINGKVRDCYEITSSGKLLLLELSNAYVDTHRALLVFCKNNKMV